MLSLRVCCECGPDGSDTVIPSTCTISAWQTPITSKLYLLLQAICWSDEGWASWLTPGRDTVVDLSSKKLSKKVSRLPLIRYSAFLEFCAMNMHSGFITAGILIFLGRCYEIDDVFWCWYLLLCVVSFCSGSGLSEVVARPANSLFKGENNEVHIYAVCTSPIQSSAENIIVWLFPFLHMGNQW